MIAGLCGAVDRALLEKFQGSEFDADAEDGRVTIKLPGGLQTVRRFARVWGCVVLASFAGLVYFYHTHPPMETVCIDLPTITSIYADGCASLG